jgi:hypothetical protein
VLQCQDVRAGEIGYVHVIADRRSVWGRIIRPEDLYRGPSG